MASTVALSPSTLASLRESGLNDDTIARARIQDGPLIKELLSKYGATDGYLIPYPEITAEFATKHSPPYRLRILRPLDMPKYLQPAKSGNHLYVPPLPAAFMPEWQTDVEVPLFITEGEKKALAGAQSLIPTLGIGGVNSWRSTTFKFPATGMKIEGDGAVRVISLNAKQARLIKEGVVPELLDIAWQNRTVYLVFDSDAETKPQVQLACVDLAYWLYEHGATTFQINLPSEGKEKVGLDDFLLTHSAESTLLNDDWLTDHSARPLPPDLKDYVSELLNGRVSRTLAEKIVHISLAALDTWGARFKDSSGGYYYFDVDTARMHEFRMDLPRLRESSFGGLLRDELGLATNDATVISRLADDFVIGATPVIPRRVVTVDSGTADSRTGEVGRDAVYVQLGDSRLARVTAEGIDIVDNGTDDQLFLAGAVAEVDEERLAEAITLPITKPRWLTALESTNLEALSPLTMQETRELLTTLFYVSPWLYRWRGAMMPLEVCVAEPNSGKTFLYNLRRGILTGRPGLSGLPDDFKGWASAVGSTGGLWVCDNLGSIRSDYWHRFADEVARLITDPSPSIDLRQLYTTSSIHHIPVQCAFAITTVKNPFTQPDILQRALIYSLKAIPVHKRDTRWYTRALEDRALWLAEHLNALKKFFRLVETEWNDHYLSGMRLNHFEQILLLMGKVLGFDLRTAVTKLPQVTAESVAEYDPVIEALAAFTREWKKDTARLRDIIDWSEMDEDHRFSNVKTMDNLILLGRYMKSHEYDIEQATGMKMFRDHNVLWLKMPSKKEKA